MNSVFKIGKKDAFWAARLKFTFFCGLISGSLLLIIFSVTMIANYRVVYDSVASNLTKAVNAVTADMPQAIPTSCLVFRYEDETTLVAENANEYETDFLYEIADFARKSKDGRFTLEGKTYFCTEINRQDWHLIAVYDGTTEMYYLRRSITVLLFSFIIGGITLLLISWFYSYYVVKPAKDAFNKQRELIANASHELKTPLTVIAANLSLLQSEPQSTVEENSKWLTAVDTQVKRMNSLILEMLDLCKTEQSDFYKERETLDVSALVSGSVLCSEAGCFEKNVTLDTQIEEGITFCTNRAAMEKLSLILLDNAVKYCEASGTVSVFLKRKRKSLIYAVSNTGKGISPEAQKHVFDRFYKGDASHNSEASSKSFGLGLSIAESIVKQLGGTLTCHSSDGITTFTVVLYE